MTSSQRRPPARFQLPLWALILLGAAIILGVGFSGAWLFRTVRDQVAKWELTDPEFQVGQSSDTAEPDVENGLKPGPLTSEVLPILSVDSLKRWPGIERVSFLLLGIDQRCDEIGPTRTDSMMVLTLDPVGLSAGALSLPRDMWVDIPGFGVDRVNQAYYLGELNEYPGGGPALAVETVETTLGIELDYYATINFDGFVSAIDQIGGITVVNETEIADDSYPDRCYGYDPFYLAEGEQTLTGDQALKFARTRITEGGDVDRAGRQQQVLLAVRDKIMQLNMLPQLLLESPKMWQTLQDSFHTNISLDEAVQLALLVRDIPRDSITTAVIDYQYVEPYTTPDGQQVLVPDRDSIRLLRDQLFRPPVVPTPVIENLPMLAAQEDARVRVINGTQIFGLAAETQSYLLRHNVNVTEIGNADASTYRTTQIIDYGQHKFTDMYLTQLMALPPLNVSSSLDPPGEFDILIILGNDWRLPQDE